MLGNFPCGLANYSFLVVKHRALVLGQLLVDDGWSTHSLTSVATL